MALSSIMTENEQEKRDVDSKAQPGSRWETSRVASNEGANEVAVAWRAPKRCFDRERARGAGARARKANQLTGFLSRNANRAPKSSLA